MDQGQYLEMLLEELPEERMGEERRKHALTRSDLRIIAALIDKRMEIHPCRLSLAPEGAIVLTEWVDTLVQVKKWSIRGVIVLAGMIVSGVLWMFAKHDMWPKGWWSR